MLFTISVSLSKVGKNLADLKKVTRSIKTLVDKIYKRLYYDKSSYPIEVELSDKGFVKSGW